MATHGFMVHMDVMRKGHARFPSSALPPNHCISKSRLSVGRRNRASLPTPPCSSPSASHLSLTRILPRSPFPHLPYRPLAPIAKPKWTGFGGDWVPKSPTRSCSLTMSNKGQATCQQEKKRLCPPFLPHQLQVTNVPNTDIPLLPSRT